MNPPLAKRIKGVPIVDMLRKLYPDQKWRVVREGFNWGYETESGWHAGWRSCLAPRYDGDDETCVSRFYVYRTDAPPQLVMFFNGEARVL